jgi:hypothetical protein
MLHAGADRDASNDESPAYAGPSKRSERADQHSTFCFVLVSPNSSVFCFVVVEQPTEPVVSTERFSITAELFRSITVVEGASRFSMIVVLWAKAAVLMTDAARTIASFMGNLQRG